MGLFDSLIKIETENLFVGEVYELTSYNFDRTEQKTSLINTQSLNEIDVVIPTLGGKYVSITNGSKIYSVVENEKEIKGKLENYIIKDIKPYRAVKENAKPVETLRQIKKFIKQMNNEKNNTLGV